MFSINKIRLKDDKAIIWLSCLYFIIRFFYLTKIPIFNDEGMYLDWGWIMTHVPGKLFFSLSVDGKQPFMMWIFGLVQELIPNPLLAGRIVSVIIGFFTLYGIYYLAKVFFNQKVAVLSAFLYIVIHVFNFYDRQALMEAGLMAVGVWSLFFLLKLHRTHKIKYAFLLGIILGIGLSIKSNTLIFYVSTIFVSFIFFVKTKSNFKIKIFTNTFVSLLISQVILLPMYFQKVFWKTLYLNSRFTYSPLELFNQPLSKYFLNIINVSEMHLWFITPVISLLMLIGIYRSFKKTKQSYIAIWFLSCILLFVLFTRNPSIRFLVPFLPLSVIFAALGLSKIIEKRRRYNYLIFVVVVIPAALFTSVQILSPVKYFSILSKFTVFSQQFDYVSGWPSGYGVPEVVVFLENEAKKTRIIVGVGSSTGNPSNALWTYYHKSRNISVIYFDSAISHFNPKGYQCIKSSSPFYFVSREKMISGFDNYLQEVKRFYKPGGISSIGLYKLRTPCQGKSIGINFAN